MGISGIAHAHHTSVVTVVTVVTLVDVVSALLKCRRSRRPSRWELGSFLTTVSATAREHHTTPATSPEVRNEICPENSAKVPSMRACRWPCRSDGPAASTALESVACVG